MKKFFAEFKEFISRGNVIDMAVGVVVGAAFKSIIDSLVNDIIMTVVGWLLVVLDFSSYALKLSETVAADGSIAVNAILYGKLINSIISFLIIAFCLFCVVKAMNTIRRKKEEEPEPTPAPEPSAEEKLLSEIRDLLKEKND